MKRVCVLVVGILLLLVTPVTAAPAYGTKMPKAGQVFCGYQRYEILNRKLNKDNGDMRSSQNHILLSYGLADWFSLDLKAGSGTIKQDPYTGDEIKYGHAVWGGGYGFRVRLFERDRVKVVAGFQHISIHPKTVKGNGEKHNAILDDWQGSSLISYDLKKLTPYMGFRYGTTDYLHRINNDADRVYTAEARRVDFVAGMDIPVTEKVWINLEGDAGAGEAVAASLNFHF